MSERVHLGVAITGALLVAASALGVTALTVGWITWSPIAGFAAAWPEVEIATTPYTRVGLLLGAVAIGAGFAALIALGQRRGELRAGRTPARPVKSRTARTCPHHDSCTPLDATVPLPAGRWVGHAPVPPRRGVADHTLEFRPRVGVSRGRLVAGGAEGSPPATHNRRPLGAAPRAERPALTSGGGMSEWATAGRQLLPEIPPTWTARSAANAAGLDETNR